MRLRTGLILILGALLAEAADAQAERTAISCTGEAIVDYKSFNLPSKTVQQTRLYVLDGVTKTVSLQTETGFVSLCEDKQDCHADFLPAGIRIEFKAGEDVEKLFYYRTANTIADQSGNAALATTFQGKCHPADAPAAAK